MSRAASANAVKLFVCANGINNFDLALHGNSLRSEKKIVERNQTQKVKTIMEFTNKSLKFLSPVQKQKG